VAVQLRIGVGALRPIATPPQVLVGDPEPEAPNPPCRGLFLFICSMVQEAHMPSGHKQEPDYGGPEPSWQSMALVAAVLAASGVSLLCLVVEWWS
jgi:hypothetical protein